MSDTTIFIVGIVVFGLALASTMVLVIPPTGQEKPRGKSVNQSRHDPHYVPEAGEIR